MGGVHQRLRAKIPIMDQAYRLGRGEVDKVTGHVTRHG